MLSGVSFKNPEKSLLTTNDTMTVFWQHVSEAGAFRDFPKTIGTHKDDLVLFRYSEIESFMDEISEYERQALNNFLSKRAPEGFQIWGLPAGAKKILGDMRFGDFLMLLETTGPGGYFTYVGDVLSQPIYNCFRLSRHLWGEEKFPIIVFLKCHAILYPWQDFLDYLSYGQGLQPMGRTYKIADKVLAATPTPTDRAFIEYIVRSYPA